MKRFIISALLCLLSPSLFAEDITFSGGYTKMNRTEGNKEIILSGGASVQMGSLSLSAQNIILSQEEYSQIQCDDTVKVSDNEKGIKVQSSSISYNRNTKMLLISSWVELEDIQNEISASGGSLRYDMDKGTMVMESYVRLLRATSKGLMLCRCDVLSYDRTNKTLQLSGNASINWDGDLYQAHVINVNLEKEEIVMEGAIQGQVHG
ncbi:MAG: LptA/OstA family protein [Sphaerochaetaceae bacterium]